MNPASNSPATPSVTTITLDDGPTGGSNFDEALDGSAKISPSNAAPGSTDGTDRANADEAAPEAKPQDPDDLVLEANRLHRQARETVTQAQRKANAILEGAKQRAQGYESFSELKRAAAASRGNPVEALAVGEKIAALLGMDVDDLTEGLTIRRAGGEVKLTEAQRLERLEKAEEEKAKKLTEEQAEAEAKAKKEKYDADYQRVLGQFKGLAKAESFPMVAADVENACRAALDLQALHWAGAQNGDLDPQGNPVKQITQIQALAAIEKTLRLEAKAHADRLAAIEGKSTAATQSPTQSRGPDLESRELTRQQAPVAAPRPTSAPVFETTSVIRSDDEIQADWLKNFANG